MQQFSINPKDELVMKLLHYFITEEEYTPIVLHGAKDEIWLENMQKGYKVIRIVSGYIRNKEQYEFDIYKTQNIVKSIKRKTFSFNINVLSIFVDIDEEIELEKIEHIDYINIKEQKDLSNSDIIKNFFPSILNKLDTKEKGIELFNKITSEINEKSKKAAEKVDDIFLPKKPTVTQTLIFINAFLFLLSSANPSLLTLYGNNPILVQNGQYYRLFTSIFFHANLIHFLFNNYALYIIGSQIENFFGKTKYLLIYLFSGLTGSLLSNAFLEPRGLSIGASGAIFGLLGAMVYFGYYYRVYFGNVVKSQIIPIIILNLFIGFSISGIDNFAHIGGLIGGGLSAMAIGIKYKKDTINEINGYIISSLYLLFLIYLVFIY